MQIITRLQYVAAQTFHELTNADLAEVSVDAVYCKFAFRVHSDHAP